MALVCQDHIAYHKIRKHRVTYRVACLDCPLCCRNRIQIPYLRDPYRKPIFHLAVPFQNAVVEDFAGHLLAQDVLDTEVAYIGRIRHEKCKIRAVVRFLRQMRQWIDSFRFRFRRCFSIRSTPICFHCLFRCTSTRCTQHCAEQEQAKSFSHVNTSFPNFDYTIP